MSPPVYSLRNEMSTGVYMAVGPRAGNAGGTAAKRPRNAFATRDAILQSATLAFSRAGYDGVGLREIAKEAGVTAILVNRYFGSKEALFEAVVERLFADGNLFSGGVEDLAYRVACGIVAKAKTVEVTADPLLLILRSASNIRASSILRDKIERHFEGPLAVRLTGGHAGMRSSMVLAVIAGFQLMYDVIGSTSLVEAKEADLSARLTSIFRTLLDGR
jgi:AcrR family transcriptional regulator